MKTRVLAYCDSPTCASGFGTVSKNIFNSLYSTGRYDIDILGINYWGDPHDFPYRIWPIGFNNEADMYGRKKTCHMIPTMQYDVLFFLQDAFILKFLPEFMDYLKEHGNGQKSICYFPVDCTPKEEWIKNVSVVDYPVAYSEYGAIQAKKAYSDCPDLEVIPHGVNTSEYFPMRDDGFRKSYFKDNADKFIFMNLNRNQQRKDIPRTIAAFVEFKKYVSNVCLYLHMEKKSQVGWDLPTICEFYGLEIGNDVIFPNRFVSIYGYPSYIINKIYNSVDCVISTTLGEGWGLSWIEAMATKTPVIMPRNTTLEIIGDMGYLVDSGSNINLFTVLPLDDVVRPLVDIDDLFEKMIVVHGNYEIAMEKAERAYKWVTSEYQWGDTDSPISQKWIKLFDKAQINYGFRRTQLCH